MSERTCAIWIVSAGTFLTHASATLASSPPGFNFPSSDLLICEMIWAGGEGFWSNPAQWAVTCTPGDGDLVVRIDTNPAVASLVHLDVSPTITSLHVDSGDALRFQPGRSLILTGLANPVVHNSGTIRLVGGPAPSELIVENSSLLLTGGGQTVLEAANARVLSEAASAWLLNFDQTVRGAGSLGSGTLGLINYATIEADQPGAALRVRPSSLAALNLGVMRATNQGRLRLIGEFSNHLGEFIAADGGRIEFENASITGGSLECDDASGMSAIDANVALRDVQLAGALEIGPVQCTIGGTIVNNGDIHLVGGSTVAPPGMVSTLAVGPGSGNVTLSGAGELHIFAGQIGSGGAANGARLIHGAAHRMHGWGPVGMDTIGFTNLGLVEADHDSPFVIDPADNDAAINQGQMRALGAGGLLFTDGVFRNDGIIEVASGSRAVYTASALEQNIAGGVISGGTWRVLADEAQAFILVPGPGAVFNSGNVLLSGSASGFTVINSLSVNTGRLEIRNGRDFTASQAFFTNGGELAVGRFSTMSFPGLFTQEPAGTLELTIATENVSQEWRVVVGGAAALAGTIKLNLAPQFQPQQGQVFQLLTAASITGAFHTIVAPPGFVINYSPNSVKCVYTMPCIGDVNGDGIIDVQDLMLIIGGWGGCPNGSMCIGDVNGDGVVNLNDLLALMELWGECP